MSAERIYRRNTCIVRSGVPADKQNGGEPQQADQASNQADTRIPERQLAIEAGQRDMRGNQR